MCWQPWGRIDLLVHFLCLLLSFMEMNLQRRKEKVDLLHVVLLSFLFQDMPGLWPLTKNRVYWIRFRWFVIVLIESTQTNKKLPLRNAVMLAIKMLVKLWFTGLYVILFIRIMIKRITYTFCCIYCGSELHFCLRDTVNILTWLIFLLILVPKKLKANIMTNL